jgi:hypothetical protein
MQYRRPAAMAGHRNDAMTDAPTYYHGTKADLKVGDLVVPGHASNFGKRKQALFVYLTATLDAATWGAELAVGAGRGRIYIVEPTGPIEDDPQPDGQEIPRQHHPLISFQKSVPRRRRGGGLAGAFARAAQADA